MHGEKASTWRKVAEYRSLAYEVHLPMGAEKCIGQARQAAAKTARVTPTVCIPGCHPKHSGRPALHELIDLPDSAPGSMAATLKSPTFLQFPRGGTQNKIELDPPSRATEFHQKNNRALGLP